MTEETEPNMAVLGRVYFEDRRQLDPQGVIDDLLGQIRRQAKDIREKKQTIERLQSAWKADRLKLEVYRKVAPTLESSSTTPPWQG